MSKIWWATTGIPKTVKDRPTVKRLKSSLLRLWKYSRKPEQLRIYLYLSLLFEIMKKRKPLLHNTFIIIIV